MPKLICFDMDGVIFEHKNFWLELHKALGTLEEGKKLTEKHLHTNYAKLVEEVVHKLWKRKDAAPYYHLIKSISYLPGVKEVFSEINKERIRRMIKIKRMTKFGLIKLKDNLDEKSIGWKQNIQFALCSSFLYKPKEVLEIFGK